MITETFRGRFRRDRFPAGSAGPQRGNRHRDTTPGSHNAAVYAIQATR
jgi:hypothetical protein